MSIWDDPDMKVNNDFIKFEHPGDTVTGTIVTIRPHRFDDGSVAPQILLQLEDGTEKTLTAGQVRLKALLAQERPEAGERITITYTNEEKRSGGKTLKHFDVTVHRGASQPALAPVAVPAQDSGNGPDPQALAAAVANLTPEQKAALGIPA